MSCLRVNRHGGARQRAQQALMSRASGGWRAEVGLLCGRAALRASFRPRPPGCWSAWSLLWCPGDAALVS